MYLKPKLVLVFLFVCAFLWFIFHLLTQRSVVKNIQVFSSNETSEKNFQILPNPQKVKAITNCYDKPLLPKTEQRGNFWVLSNYIVATRKFKCHESITITTQGDFTFLDNLVPLVERWRGPISVALYAPGTDFDPTVSSILYLRHCTTNLIKELVTFHIFFESDHIPDNVSSVTLILRFF